MINKKIVISGYYGYGNLGDEAILESMLKSFKTYFNLKKIIVLSNDVQKTMNYGVKSQSSRSIIGNVQALHHADLFISGGGGLTNDLKFFSFLVYLLRIYVATIICKKSMIYAQGIGPIQRNISRNLCKIVLNRVNMITVRDQESMDLLKNIGITKPILVTADPVFALEPSENRLNNETFFKYENKKSVIIILRPFLKGKKLFEFEKTIAKFSDFLITKEWNVFFMPFQEVYDDKIILGVLEQTNHKDKIKVMSKFNAQETLNIIRKMDLVIGMRLHSLIMACIVETPMIGLVYDIKVRNFLKLVNQEKFAIDVNFCEYNELIHKFKIILDNKSLINYKLKSNKHILKNKALKNVHLMNNVLNGMYK